MRSLMVSSPAALFFLLCVRRIHTRVKDKPWHGTALRAWAIPPAKRYLVSGRGWIARLLPLISDQPNLRETIRFGMPGLKQGRLPSGG